MTYLRTHEGWMYLAIVMDLYSRKIIGWAMDKRMTIPLVARAMQMIVAFLMFAGVVPLVARAMQMAIHLRRPAKGLIFHSDRGSQYTSQPFQQLLQRHTIRASMSGVGACWDNAVVERFFGSLKNEWLLKVYHLTRQGMKQDVEHYIRYYNQQRLHSANGDLSPVEFELSQMKVPSFA